MLRGYRGLASHFRNSNSPGQAHYRAGSHKATLVVSRLLRSLTSFGMTCKKLQGTSVLSMRLSKITARAHSSRATERALRAQLIHYMSWVRVFHLQRALTQRAAARRERWYHQRKTLMLDETGFSGQLRSDTKPNESSGSRKKQAGEHRHDGSTSKDQNACGRVQGGSKKGVVLGCEV